MIAWLEKQTLIKWKGLMLLLAWGVAMTYGVASITGRLLRISSCFFFSAPVSDPQDGFNTCHSNNLPETPEYNQMFFGVGLVCYLLILIIYFFLQRKEGAPRIIPLLSLSFGFILVIMVGMVKEVYPHWFAIVTLFTLPIFLPFAERLSSK